MTPPKLGEQQLALLQFVTEHAPIALSEVFEQFGAPRQLARTTIHTMLEALRRKGYLTRAKIGGTYRYSPCASAEDVQTDLIGNFLQRSLQGSLKPLVAYLMQHPEITAEELDDLKALVKTLDAQHKEARDGDQ